MASQFKGQYSLGEVSFMLAGDAAEYINIISVVNGKVVDVTPKSKRTSNANHALVTIAFDVIEKTIPDHLTQEEREVLEHFIYSIENNEAHITQWIGDKEEKKAIIPAQIENVPVISLNGNIFRPNDNVTGEVYVEEIVISEGIKTIGSSVLFNVEEIKKIVFPESIEYISPDVFVDEQGQYKDLYLNESTVYVAPAGSYAEKFLKSYKPERYNMEALTVINDDSSEKQEEINALRVLNFTFEGEEVKGEFKNFWKYQETPSVIKIPEKYNGHSISVINMYGIPHGVKSLTIPASTTTLLHLESNTLFLDNGNAMETVNVDEDNPVFWSDGKAIYSKDRKRLIRFMAYTAREYSILDTTECIEASAFNGMRNLRKLVIPASVKRLGNHCFSGCESLEEIIGLEHITEVGDGIFGAGVWTSSESVPYVKNRDVVQVASDLVKYNALSEPTCRLPDGITRICRSALGFTNDDDQMVEVVIPSTVKVIEPEAFRGRKFLKRINLPEGLTEITDSVFSGCEALETIYVPASVKSISTNAFPIYIPRSFYNNETKSTLQCIEVDPNNEKYCSINGMLLSKDKTQLLFVPSMVKSIDSVLCNGVTEIAAYAVYYHENIEEMVIPPSVSLIGKRAFGNCFNLKKITFPDELENIGEYAFDDCKKLETIILPKNLKTVGNGAFRATGIKTLDLPDGVEHIGEEAFARCELESVIVPRSVKTLGWGAFSCVPEISVYDSIDPDAQDCYAAIDTCNGEPNSLLGYIGIGPAYAIWTCAANHRWVDYSITVLSSETGEIKYKVWMGADASQRVYYCMLSSAWGHNATFAFEKLDEFFPKIRGAEHKLQVAQYRLAYPVELTDKAKKKYEDYVNRMQRGE